MSTPAESSTSASKASSSRLPPKTRPDPIPRSTTPSSTSDPFASLPPAFDPERFQPPAWAKDMAHLNRSCSAETGQDGKAGSSSGMAQRGAEDEGGGDDTESLGLSEQDTLWEDAREDLDDVVDTSTGEFKLTELSRLLDKATGLKAEGNSHFVARPPRYDEAVQAYKAALACLPERKPQTADIPDADDDGPSMSTRVADLEGSTSTSSSSKAAAAAAPPLPSGGSGIQELTEAEAAALESELLASQIRTNDAAESRQSVPKTEEEERDEVYDAIAELRKVCNGNLGAVYLVKTGKEKECVEVCTEALEIDPLYVKALQRRAAANDRLNTWSSLTAAQEDYTSLLSLLPTSAHAPIRRVLVSLPARITTQQEKEKDEMMSKLKDLGNGLLGKFGLSTDMFKFDQQEGGGYSMRFER